jgi:hypothetical protein
MLGTEDFVKTTQNSLSSISGKIRKSYPRMGYSGTF